MRKHYFRSIMYVILFILLAACSKTEPETKKIVAKINDYNLTLDEFQYQLASELELDKNFKLTRDAKEKFLDQLIRKELLIQEAKKLKLDTREEFRRAIEKYWESTLIRNLLVVKGKEIDKRCVVSEEEIQSRYNKMKEKDPHLPPLANIREEIAHVLRDEKKTKLLEQWMAELRKKASIKINQSLL